MPARRAALALGLVALSAGALGACGGSGVQADSVPKSTPDLTVPANASSLPGVTTSTTSTTSTTPTTTTGTATTPSNVTPSSTSQAPSTPQTTTSTPSGGTATPQTTTPSSGGTPAGGFSAFCQQNPGACGQ